ncbi:MAG TPA: hypothetical protein VGK17_24035 [Propionicimonas sp.]
MANTLVPGQVRVGQLVDTNEDDGRPVQSAALTFDPARGVEVLVPYVRGMEQFATAVRWFHAATPPKALLFVDELGTVTLTGVGWRGDSGTACGTGRLGASVAVFGQPRRLKEEYRIREMRSSIDGLAGFADFRPVDYDFPNRGEPAVITLDDSAMATWRSSGFTYSLGARAAWSGSLGTSFAATAVPFISTHRARGATPAEHLRAQWAIRDLLLFVHGRKLAWRSHRVIDDQFPLFTLDGATHGPDPAETHFSGTVAEHALPEPSGTSLAFPPLRLAALGSTGLKRWTDLYADDRFRRAAQPVAEVINGAATFLEPQLMMLAAALDYFGYYRYADRKSRPMHASILKCLDSAELDWPTIGTRAGIARAISNVNNDLKHPDREQRPDSDALRGVTALARVIARAQVFDLLHIDAAVRPAFLRSIDGRRPIEMFSSSGLTIADDGKFLRNA